MKTYLGIPGNPPVISVVDDVTGKTAILPCDPCSWGDKGPGGAVLALTILKHELGGIEATRFARRFLWRTVVTWPAGKPWTFTSKDIANVIRDIEETEQTTAGARNRVITERPPVGHDGGLGAGGSPIVWDRDGGLR